MNAGYPERIVCLTDETTETLYLLEEDWRIVGISGFTVRPERARREKPIVTSFEKAKISQIVELQPDLVLGFSDVQAEIASHLISAGIEVHVFNHRTIAGILRMIKTLGALVGCNEKAATLAANLQSNLAQPICQYPTRPRIYFEEWNDPLITGIGWVSELIEIAGGTDVFAHLSLQSLAKNRMVADPTEVIRRDPDIIFGSWCGKPFRAAEVRARDGWDKIKAVRTDEIHEVDSSIILQPGPAALTDGIQFLRQVIEQWQAKNSTG